LLTDAYIALRKSGMTDMAIAAFEHPQWFTERETFVTRRPRDPFEGWGWQMEPTEFDKEIAENQKPTKEQEERMRKLMDDITKALERRIEYEKTMMSEWDRWFFDMQAKHPELALPPKGRWDDPNIKAEDVFKDLDKAVETAKQYGWDWKTGWYGT
jgi:hypothetical protein